MREFSSGWTSNGGTSPVSAAPRRRVAPGGRPSDSAEATVSVTDYLFDAGASNMGWLRINGIDGLA
jgi:hypothetical protein